MVPFTTHSIDAATYSSSAESAVLHRSHASTTGTFAGKGFASRIFDGAWSRVDGLAPQYTP
jgi:hypothetical protein